MITLKFSMQVKFAQAEGIIPAPETTHGITHTR